MKTICNRLKKNKKLSIFNWHSHSSYTQVNGHVEDFATTTTSPSQNKCPVMGIHCGSEKEM